MDPARRVFLAACVLSLLAHLGVLGNAPLWWTPPAEEVPFPITARLDLATPALPAPLPAPRPHISPSLPAPAPSAPIPSPPIPAAPVSPIQPEPIPLPPLPPTPTPVPTPVTPPIPLPPPPPAVEPPPKALRSLPPRLTLRYGVQSGEEGFGLGRAVYTWQAGEGRYRLESVAEATGLLALFVSGRIRQTSEGRLSQEGLQPEQFSQSRGDRRPDTARLDWAERRIDLNGSAAPLPLRTQDLLSFPFHLALTLREDDGEWRLPVTNGRRVNDYAFLVLGRESLEFRGEAVETLHVRGARSGEGALDVWLAPSRSWLPLRIRTLDTKGKALTLNLEEAGA